MVATRRRVQVLAASHVLLDFRRTPPPSAKCTIRLECITRLALFGRCRRATHAGGLAEGTAKGARGRRQGNRRKSDPVRPCPVRSRRRKEAFENLMLCPGTLRRYKPSVSVHLVGRCFLNPSGSIGSAPGNQLFSIFPAVLDLLPRSRFSFATDPVACPSGKQGQHTDMGA